MRSAPPGASSRAQGRGRPRTPARRCRNAGRWTWGFLSEFLLFELLAHIAFKYIARHAPRKRGHPVCRGFSIASPALWNTGRIQSVVATLRQGGCDEEIQASGSVCASSFAIARPAYRGTARELQTVLGGDCLGALERRC